MSDYIEITYQVEDGYVSGSRPLKVKIHLYEFDDCLTEDEVSGVIESAVENHMAEHVYPVWSRDYITEVMARKKSNE